jgi:hypothetical protein
LEAGSLLVALVAVGAGTLFVALSSLVIVFPGLLTPPYVKSAA